MKIVYISKYFDVPSSGETGSRGFHLCRELSRYGHDTTVFATKPPHLFAKEELTSTFTQEKFESLTVVFVKTIKFEKRRSVARILTWVEFELKVAYYILKHHRKADVIIASSLALFSVATAHFFKRLFGTKVIFEIRDIWPLSIIEQGGFSPKHPFIRLLSMIEKLGYRRSDHIIGTMPNLIEHVDKTCKMHAPVSCIPMGISQEHEQTVGEAVPGGKAHEFDFLPEGKFIVGYAGGFGTANALEFIFEAARLVENPDIHFVLVGDGNLKEEYIARYGDLANVNIGPRLRKQEVGSFSQHCDLLTFAANPAEIWKYGHSLNKIVDYMLAAKPMLCIYNGYDEMVSAAECGFFVESADAREIAQELERVAQIPKEELTAMGERGRSWLLENRRYPILGKKYEAIIRSVVKGSSSST